MFKVRIEIINSMGGVTVIRTKPEHTFEEMVELVKNMKDKKELLSMVITVNYDVIGNRLVALPFIK